MPKQDILPVIEEAEREQQKIAMMNAQAKIMQQKAQQFLMEDPEAQASQLMEAEQVGMTEEPIEEPVEEVPM